MTYSYTEKKRIRKDFSKLSDVMEVPYLLAIQLDSYREFLQQGRPREQLKDAGLHAAFKSVFPIISNSGYAALEYAGYRLGDAPFDVKECVMRGVTYAAPLRVKLRLIIFDRDSPPSNKAIKDINRRACSLTTTAAKPTVPASCSIRRGLFPTVALGWILSSMPKMRFLCVSTVVANCPRPYCCVP